MPGARHTARKEDRQAQQPAGRLNKVELLTCHTETRGTRRDRPPTNASFLHLGESCLAAISPATRDKPSDRHHTARFHFRAATGGRWGETNISPGTPGQRPCPRQQVASLNQVSHPRSGSCPTWTPRLAYGAGGLHAGTGVQNSRYCILCSIPAAGIMGRPVLTTHAAKPRLPGSILDFFLYCTTTLTNPR